MHNLGRDKMLKARLLSMFRSRGSGPAAEIESPEPVMETILDIARQVRQHGDPWRAFEILQSEQIKNPSREIEAELCEIIGTSTQYGDVQSAMDLFFDNEYYLKNNNDVRNYTKDGNIHYLMYGWKEHRNPSLFFNDTFYRSRTAGLRFDEFPLSHFAKIGQFTDEAANAISKHYWFIPFIPSEKQWNALPSATMNNLTEAVVVIPVYKGIEETLTAIYQALSSRLDAPYSVLVVNDKSPDAEMNLLIQHLSEKKLFDYYSSDVNRGFVQTCNLAINELTHNLDVILLNSDAYVFPNWYRRLRNHAEDPTVASVTPLSNNATICSYPLINCDNALALECTPQQLDVIASTANQGLAIETPTGVGFCFYMKRLVIDEIGALDSKKFKVGYGEENDFCMRALNKGYKNLIAGDIFVFHTGSVSFSAIKEEHFNLGQKALVEKHPNYPSLVRSHVSADPEKILRQQLDAKRLIHALSEVTVFVTHRWGGGIETYINEQKKKLRSSGKDFITLTVHSSHFASIDTCSRLFLPNLLSIDLRREFFLVKNLILDLKPILIHVNSFAGIDWYWHKKFLELIGYSGIPYKYIAHDYSSISHHYQLLRPDNFYAPPPSLEARERWVTMNDLTGAIDVCDPKERLAAYTKFLEAAETVEVPSCAAQAILFSEFPSINFEVVPHDDHLPDVPPAKRSADKAFLKVLIIGALGHHKGSDVVTSLAIDAKNRNLAIEYYLVGYSNDDDLLKSYGIKISGRYRTEVEALDRVSEIQPDIVLIPSIWHETFCYALSIAMKLRIPPLVFDIGAQAERVAKIRWGLSMPISYASNPVQMSDALLSIDIDKLWDERE